MNRRQQAQIRTGLTLHAAIAAAAADTEDQQHTTCSGRRFARLVGQRTRMWWCPSLPLSQRQQGATKHCMVVAWMSVLLLLLLVSIRLEFESTTTTATIEHTTMKNSQQCTKSSFTPFRVGCPATCVGYRPGIVKPEPDMYRMSFNWDFGRTENSLDVNAFQSSPAFTRAYFRSNQTVAQRVLGAATTTTTTNFNNIEFVNQQKIHLNLAYFCCLMKNETSLVVEAMHNWVRQYEKFDFRVRFNHLECWNIRNNMVTNILVGDEETQRTVYEIHNDLGDYILKDVGIDASRFVPRSIQMPFHITLNGFRRLGNKDDKQLYDYFDWGQYKADDAIAPLLGNVYSETVASVSRQHWSNSTSMSVRFAPETSGFSVIHNRPPEYYDVS